MDDGNWRHFRRFRAVLEWTNFHRQVDISLIDEFEGNTRIVQVPRLDLEVVPENSYINPTIQLSTEQAQQIYDQLHMQGFRCSQILFSADDDKSMGEQIMRMERHISDIKDMHKDHVEDLRLAIREHVNDLRKTIDETVD